MLKILRGQGKAKVRQGKERQGIFLEDFKPRPFCAAPEVATNLALSLEQVCCTPSWWSCTEGPQKTWIKHFTGNLNQAFHREASNMNIWAQPWWLRALQMSGLAFEAPNAYFRDRFAPHSTPLNLLSAKALWLQLPWNRERSLQCRSGDAGARSHFTARHTRCLSPAQPFKKLPAPAPREAEG